MRKLYDYLKADSSSWSQEIRVHATKRMYQRNISHDDLHNVLLNGFVIEQYDTDFPFPSCLLNGKSENGRPLHVVVGVDAEEKRLYIITVYEPEFEKWTDDFSRRLE